jgi:hypothetical protein
MLEKDDEPKWSTEWLTRFFKASMINNEFD